MGRQAWPCWRCHIVKPRADFPLGRAGKRRSAVCMVCMEVEAHEINDARTVRVATWVDPATGRTVRRCSSCKEVKDLERDYYNAPKALPGSKWPVNLPCKRCKDAYRRERYHRPERLEKERAIHRASSQRYLQRYPERKRESNKRRWEKVKADPKLHQHVLEVSRMNARLRKERDGQEIETVRNSSKVHRGVVRVPAGPLVAMIEGLVEHRAQVAGLLADSDGSSVEAVCADLGIKSRTLRRWRTGAMVDIGHAERVLLNANVDWHDVYSYDDHAEAFLGHEVPA